MVASLQVLWLLEQLEALPDEDKKNEANFEERKSELRQLLETDEEALDAIYKWYVLKCPQVNLNEEEEDKYAGLKVAVKRMGGRRVSPFYWQDAIVSFLLRPIVQVRHFFAGWRHWRSREISCFNYLKKDRDLIDLLKVAHRHQHQQVQSRERTSCCHWFSCGCRQNKRRVQPKEAAEKFDYEFVWFNAWLYSGFSTLWAGLIMELYKATENHFGNDYANAQIKAKFYRALLAGIVTGALLGLSIFLATFQMDYEVINFSQVIAPVISGMYASQLQHFFLN